MSDPVSTPHSSSKDRIAYLKGKIELIEVELRKKPPLQNELRRILDNHRKEVSDLERSIYLDRFR
jgi:hypothetical protein